MGVDARARSRNRSAESGRAGQARTMGRSGQAFGSRATARTTGSVAASGRDGRAQEGTALDLLRLLDASRTKARTAGHDRELTRRPAPAADLYLRRRARAPRRHRNANRAEQLSAL